MVMTLDEFFNKQNQRKGRVLQLLEMALHNDERFKAIRTQLLNEFGRSGMERDVRELLSSNSRNETGRLTQARKEVP